MREVCVAQILIGKKVESFNSSNVGLGLGEP